MRKYELTYLVSDTVPEKDQNKITGTVSGFVTELGGKIEKEDIWGRRKLAYPIQKQEFATYVTVFFNLAADKVLEFEHNLRTNSSILRHLLIVRDYGDKDYTLTAEEIAETADIETVIGGEKSFEAVEGQTEDSRDLMAKRQDKSAEEEPEVAAEEIESDKSAEEVEKEEPKVKAAKKSAKEDEMTEAIEEKVKEKSKKTAEAKPKTEEKTETAGPKKTAKKETKELDESERLSKLNEELEDILKDEL